MTKTGATPGQGLPDVGVPAARSARTYSFVALGLAVVLGYLVWDILGYASVPFAALGIVGGLRALPRTKSHPRDRRAAFTAIAVSIGSILLLVPPTISAMNTSSRTPRLSAGCESGAATEGASQLDVTTPGGNRPALAFVPEGAGPHTAFPVVLALAGADIDAPSFAQLIRLEETGSSERFTVVYPSPSASPGWNPALESDRPDDVAYITEVINEVRARYCVDLDRVFVVGHSLGGAMAERVACDLSDRIAAVAVVSGAYIGEGCTPVRPIPRLALHGTADHVAPYDGGGEFDVDGAEARALSWGAAVGCSSTLEEDHVEEGSVLLFASSCDAPVQLWRIDGGGHEWSEFTSRAVWDFFFHASA